MTDRWIVYGTLIISLVLFVRGTWRYDLVALAVLLFLSAMRIVPAADAFLGFGHPAVITVVAVLAISAALKKAGAVDLLATRLERLGESRGLHVFILMLLVVVSSAFMNNVGAMAILMPAAIQLARRADRSPGYLLMPLAFGSLLGGLTTVIGTPPNIIIATMRDDIGAAPFAMFDFAYVGVGVAAAGVLFISVGGWRLLPERQGEASVERLFEIEKYTTELSVGKESQAVGLSVREIGQSVESECMVIALSRDARQVFMPSLHETLAVGDILLVEGDAEAIKSLSDALNLSHVGDKELREALLKSESIEVIEAIVTPDSYIEHSSVGQLNLRRRFGINLLGIARQGRRLRKRLRDIVLRAGDILLLQGDGPALRQAFNMMGCLPLATRELRVGQPKRVWLAVALFVAALGVMLLGWLPIQIALTICVIAMVLTKLLTLREAYHAIDWPIIILLGAMIPVGHAMETTGGAHQIALGLHALTYGFPPDAAIGLILLVTTLLSNVINNTAAAVLMAPIALQLADKFAASTDPFLMAVALGASSAYLTPIGHQSNTLVLGPGAYRFGDYFRLGLPVTLITWCIGLPLILWFWKPYP